MLKIIKSSTRIQAAGTPPKTMEEFIGPVASEARRLAIPSLSVSATLNAVGFYSARGYTLAGAAQNVLPQGTTLPYVKMEKTLAV